MKSRKILNRVIEHSSFDFISETPGINVDLIRKVINEMHGINRRNNCMMLINEKTYFDHIYHAFRIKNIKSEI